MGGRLVLELVVVMVMAPVLVWMLVVWMLMGVGLVMELRLLKLMVMVVGVCVLGLRGVVLGWVQQLMLPHHLLRLQRGHINEHHLLLSPPIPAG